MTSSNETGYRYEYRANQKTAVSIFLSAIVFTAIGYFVESGHALFMYGAAVVCFLIGLFRAADNRILLAFDERGVFIGGQNFQAGQIAGFKITSKRDGVAVRHYFYLSLQDGSHHRVDLGRLDQPLKEIIKAMADVLGEPGG
ncbi:MAG: hypothetical protein KDA68_02695 [Planctomycetaceae bacterium]|nr:hypothetical protein [Planctomycetaceae bacterium]